MSGDGDHGAVGRGDAPHAAGNAERGAAAPADCAGERPVRWTAAMRDGFFAHLAGSCNVVASARAIGVSLTQVHHRRRTDAAFASLWAEAIEAGYQLLEMRMLGQVLADGGDAIAADDPDAPGPVQFDGAMKLMTLHRGRRAGLGKAGGLAGGGLPGSGVAADVATPEATDAAILRRLAMLADRRGRSDTPVAGTDTASAA